MKKIVIIFVFILLIALFMFYMSNKFPTTSPLKSSVYFMYNILSPHKNMNKEVLGFLPYWRLDDIRFIRSDLVTEVNYFSLFANGDGNFIKVIDGETNPGWREWNNQKVKDLIAQTQIRGGKFSLSIAVQDNGSIKDILDNKSSQDRLINNILSEVKEKKLDGINIDFEYQGEPDEKYQQKFTSFSKLLKETLYKQSLNIKLYLSIMPRSARDKDLFDFKNLNPIYDRFIGMSYDYSGVSSDTANATAPMTGFKENKFYFDVTTTYTDYLRHMPKEKIIMGVPYYGWDWAVEEGSKIQSRTLSSDDPGSYSAVMSYARSKEDRNLKKSQCKFDDYAMQPWCWYTDTKTRVDHQVWFENEKSIGIKYDFANKNDLSGVAIWVLGYDKDYPELWNLIKNNFTKK